MSVNEDLIVEKTVVSAADIVLGDASRRLARRRVLCFTR